MCKYLKSMMLFLAVFLMAGCGSESKPPSVTGGQRPERSGITPPETVDVGETEKAQMPPHIYIHPIQWNSEVVSDVNEAARYLLSDKSINDAYEGDDLVFPMVVAFFLDKVPGAGSTNIGGFAPVMNIIAMAYLKDHYATRKYTKTLEIPNGSELVAKAVPNAPIDALSSAFGTKFTLVKFPFPEITASDDVYFTEVSIFGAAGAVANTREEIEPLRQSYGSLTVQEPGYPGVEAPIDGMVSAEGLVFNGVLVFESVDPGSLTTDVSAIVESHVKALGLSNSNTCINAIMSHENFVTARLHYIQFKRSVEPKAYPPYSPSACTGDDWVHIGRNLLTNGCALPQANCHCPRAQGCTTAVYKKHMGTCASGGFAKGAVDFNFVDENASKYNAFTLVGMMVNENGVWYFGELDEYVISECGL